MKRLAHFFILPISLLTFLFVIPFAHAIDLGIEMEGAEGTADQPDEVKVINLPIKTIKKNNDSEETMNLVPIIALENKVFEITEGVTLKAGDVYESPFVDVRLYRHITFYVVPSMPMTAPQPEVYYELDAFFSAMAGVTKNFKKFGEKKTMQADQAIGEFGAMRMNTEGESESSFVKLSTGITSTSRALTTPIYGPYVRVTLTNHSAEENAHFKILAYLSM